MLMVNVRMRSLGEGLGWDLDPKDSPRGLLASGERGFCGRGVSAQTLRSSYAGARSKEFRDFGMFVTFLIVGYIVNTTVLLLLFGLFGVLPVQPLKKYGE